MRRPTKTLLSAPIALALLSTLGACGGTYNPGLGSVHQPVVARTDFIYDLPAPSGTMGARDAQLLTGWFDSLQLRYGDRIAVDTQGYGIDARDAIAGVTARYGLLVDETAPVTQGAIAPGAVRIIVSRTSATVPGCPDFSRPSSPEFGGSTPSNYGCAVNANLAAMTADPRDLIAGRVGDGTSDVAASGRAIKTYRDGKVAPLKNESTRGQ